MTANKQNLSPKKIQTSGELLANVRRLQINAPQNFNWKEDYAKALEEKYASIY